MWIKAVCRLKDLLRSEVSIKLRRQIQSLLEWFESSLNCGNSGKENQPPHVN